MPQDQAMDHLPPPTPETVPPGGPTGAVTPSLAGPLRTHRRSLWIAGAVFLVAAVMQLDSGLSDVCAMGLGPFVLLWIAIDGIRGMVRRSLRHLLIRGALVFLASVLGLVGGMGIRQLQWAAAHAQGDRIAEALETCRAIQGHYPNDLELLLPDHLERIPKVAVPGLIQDDLWFYRQWDDTYQMGWNGELLWTFWREPDGLWRRDD